MMMHRNIPFSLGFSQFPLPFHLELFLPLNKAKSESIEQKPPLEKKSLPPPHKQVPVTRVKWTLIPVKSGSQFGFYPLVFLQCFCQECEAPHFFPSWPPIFLFKRHFPLRTVACSWKMKEMSEAYSRCIVKVKEWQLLSFQRNLARYINFREKFLKSRKTIHNPKWILMT